MRQHAARMEERLMAEFFNMGGYAAYVWPAYAAAALGLGALTVAIVRRNARTRQELIRVEARDDVAREMERRRG